MYTFGLGSEVSEELVMQCALKGFGNFKLINNAEELEQSLVSALGKPRIAYKILHKMVILDSEGQPIDHE